METYYKISKKDLMQLFDDAMSFRALFNAGVDDWEWYFEAFEDFTGKDVYWEDYIQERFKKEFGDGLYD